MSELTDVQSLLERLILASGCPNVNDSPPPPLTTWEAMQDYLTHTIGSETLTEVWWVDRSELRTDNASYRTAAGAFYNRQSWEIAGILERDSWATSHNAIQDRVESITAYLQHFIDLGAPDSSPVNITSEWSFNVRWHQFGERWVFSGIIELDLILIES